MSKQSLKANSSIIIPSNEMEITFVRSSGPGGQNVNKVNSRAVLRWNVKHSASLPESVKDRFLRRYSSKITLNGEIIISSSETRDQMKNLDRCYRKLRIMLQSVIKPPKVRIPSKPSRAAKMRRIDNKVRHSKKKKLRKFVLD